MGAFYWLIQKKFWNSSFLLFSLKVLVTQLCPTVCNSMSFSLPGSSNHGKLQEKILKRAAIPFSRGSSKPRDLIQVSCIADEFFTIWATKKACFFTLQSSVSLKISKIWLKKKKGKKNIPTRKWAWRFCIYVFYTFFLKSSWKLANLVVFTTRLFWKILITHLFSALIV